MSGAQRRGHYAPLGEDKFIAIKRDYDKSGELLDNAAYGFVKV